MSFRIKDKPAFAKATAGKGLRTKERNGGQALLVSMLFLSMMMLLVTGVAVLLVSYQIRQSVDSVSSTKSIFAADAGIEDGLLCYFNQIKLGAVAGDTGNPLPESDVSFCERADQSMGSSTYSTALTFLFADGTESSDPFDPAVATLRVTATGKTGKTVRILETDVALVR